MRVDPEDLKGFASRPVVVPPPIEPLLAPRDEVALLTGRDQSDPTIPARRRRVRRLLLSVAVPQGDDAAVIVLLAARRALPIEHPRERVTVRLSLVDIGNADDPPPEVVEELRRLDVPPGHGSLLADRLMPPERDFHAFAENWPVGSGGIGS